MPDPLLQLGFVYRAHGLRGELKIQLFDADSDALDRSKQLWLGPQDAEGEGSSSPASAQSKGAAQGPRAGFKRHELRALRRIGEGLYLVSLAGVTSREAAESLQRHGVYLDRAELPQLEEDEYYVSDIVGYQVVLLGGGVVGSVQSILATTASSLMVVSRIGASDALIPMVPEIVHAVSRDERTVVIDPPEGLLEINEPSERDEPGDHDGQDEHDARGEA